MSLRNKGRSGRRPSSTRIKLTTEDIAKLFGVKPDTIRHWITQGKLTFTGDPLVDLLMLQERLRLWNQ